MSGFEWATTDLCDANEDLFATCELRVVPPGWLCLGRRMRFHGPVVTLKLFEDNSVLADAVKQPGQGRVLAVDAGGSRRCAVFGGNLAATAANNGWAGAIIHGSVRDADEIDACEIGVRALALNPRRPAKRGEGQRDVPIEFCGVAVRPGEWIYADRDGILVASKVLCG
jgi:regulator of ribonuclease activity A